MPIEKPYDKFAEIYDAFMNNRFYQEYYRFVLKILKRIGFQPNSILEIACGTGKLMNVFHRKGWKIEGLDLSEKALEVAKRKGLKVHYGNMIDFKLGKHYSLILDVFDSLNYIQKLSDLQKCFKTVNAHLAEDGLFIFDMNSDFKINELIPSLKTEYHKVGDTELIWLNSHKPDTWILKLIMFSRTNSKYERFYEKHIEKAYSLRDVKTLLKKADFELFAVYSDFKFNKVKKNSRRWFFVAKRL